MVHEFKKRSRQEELVRLGVSIAGTIALLVIAVFAVRGAWNMYGKLSDASEGSKNSQDKLTQLQAREKQLQISVGELSSPRGVEAEMRERFGATKPGEGVIQIVRNTASDTSANAAPEGLWQRLFRTLFVW